MTESLSETIERACQRATREVLLIHAPQCVHDLPPPAAIEAERAIVGALLAGWVAPADLAPLRAVDLYVPLHAAVVISIEAIGGADLEQTIPRIVCGLRAQGLAGADSDIVDELLRLRDGAPVVLDMSRRVVEILEAARRRRLSRALRDGDLALRLGAPIAEVTRKLEEALRG